MQTIIFDFGNVVGFFDHWRALRKLEPIAAASAQQMYDLACAGPLGDDIESGRIGAEEFLRRFKSECGITCSDEFLEEACADIFWPNSEVCELIPRLKPRYRILLGSNTNVIHACRFKKQFADVLRHFDALILSHEIGVRKPKVDFFHHCQKHSRGKPEEVLFLDDVADNVASARTLGWQGIVYQPNDGLLAKLAAAGVSV